MTRVRIIKKIDLPNKYLIKKQRYLVPEGSVLDPKTKTEITIKNKPFKNIVEFVKTNPMLIQAAYHLAYFQLLSQNINLYNSLEIRELALDRDFEIMNTNKKVPEDTFSMLFKYDIDEIPRASDAAYGLRLAIEDFQLLIKDPDAVLGVDYIERLLNA